MGEEKITRCLAKFSSVLHPVWSKLSRTLKQYFYIDSGDEFAALHVCHMYVYSSTCLRYVGRTFSQLVEFVPGFLSMDGVDYTYAEGSGFSEC